MLDATTANTINPWIKYQSMGLLDSIVSAESGGDPTAKNPNSSATGAGQFIESTWLNTIGRYRPDLVQGKSRDEILAMRNDPVLSREMTDAYAKQNQDYLAKNGVSVTPGSTYLAHFAGPQGAVKILQADPNAPIEGILDAKAIAANPFLKGMTAQGVQAWAAKKMGVEAPSPQNNAPASPASPPIALPQGAPPTFAPPPQAPQQVAQQEAPQAPLQFDQMQLAPIFMPQRRPINLSALRNAFNAPTFARG